MSGVGETEMDGALYRQTKSRKYKPNQGYRRGRWRVVAGLAVVGELYLLRIKGCGPERCPVWERLKWTVAQ